MADPAEARHPFHPDFQPGDLLWLGGRQLSVPLGRVGSCSSEIGVCRTAGYPLGSCSLSSIGWFSEQLGDYLMPEIVSTGLPRIAQPVTLSTAAHAEVPRSCNEVISPTGRVAPDGSPIYCTRIEVPIAPGEIAVAHGIAGLREVVSLGGMFRGAGSAPRRESGRSCRPRRRNVTVRIDGAALRLHVVDPRGSWGQSAGFVEVEFTLGL